MSPYYATLRQAIGHGSLLIPSVAAIIRDEAERLLLVEKRDGSWSLPAGAIEPCETPEEAVAREVMEETGFRCEQLRLIAAVGGDRSRPVYPNHDQVEYVILMFRCTAHPLSQPSDAAETKGLSYFHRSEMPPLALPYDYDHLF